jgi:hypothetical protein
VLAYDYPLLGIFWTTLWFLLWVMWLILLFRIFADIFQSQDLGGLAKTAWVIFVIIAPFLGVFVYILARGDKMTEHAIAQAQAQQDAMADYVRNVAGSDSGGVAAELSRLADLKDRGVITEAEFADQKSKLLA